MGKKGEKILEERKDIVHALVESGKSYREVASTLGISIGSVHKIMHEPDELIFPLVEQLKKRLSARHYLLSDYILSRISELNMTYASLKDKVIASAILIDKARLIDDSFRGRGIKELEELKKENERLNTQKDDKAIELKEKTDEFAVKE
ncbi:MAG: hypothetical protein HY805_02020 [Nitrospirae bacterium]|nr:hypothetical protein [Nitrospirota bacterium]